MPRKVLIPVDGSVNSDRAFHYYLDGIHKPDDQLIIVHIQPAPQLPSFSIHQPITLPTEEWGKVLTEQVEKSHALMNKYEVECELRKIPKIPLFGSGGKPGEKICEYAKSHHADMIIIGSRGLNGVRRTFLGSVSDYVLHHVHLPVLIIPPLDEQ